MDTRFKIISAGNASELAGRLKRQGRKLLVVQGSFDLLLATHALSLQKARDNAGGTSLMVLLTQPSVPLLSEQARAELLAGLHMVDYVVTAGNGSAKEFLDRLEPGELASAPVDDEEHTRQLIEHVHRRHSP